MSQRFIIRWCEQGRAWHVIDTQSDITEITASYKRLGMAVRRCIALNEVPTAKLS